MPSYFSETNYTSAQLINEVMKRAVKGDWPGAEPFVKAMAALKIDAVRGPVAFDDMRNPVHNIYIKKVEKKSCSVTTRTSSGTPSSRPIRMSVSSGPTTRRRS